MPLAFRACKMPDDLNIARLGYLNAFVRQSDNAMRPKWALGERKLLDYLVVFIRSGHGVFTLEHDSFEMSSGDLFWVPPNTLHSMRGDSEEMNCIFFHFDLRYDPLRSNWDANIPEYTRDLSEYANLMHPPIFDYEINHWRGKIKLFHHVEEIGELMAEICREHRRYANHTLRLSALVLILLEKIGFAATPLAGNGDLHEHQLSAAAQYMEKHYNEPDLSIAEVARKYGLSVSYFRKLFRAKFGRLPLEYLRDLRDRKAKDMLIYTDLPPGDIAILSGSRDIYDFSRSFKQRNHVSPLAYRRRQLCTLKEEEKKD